MISKINTNRNLNASKSFDIRQWVHSRNVGPFKKCQSIPLWALHLRPCTMWRRFNEKVVSLRIGCPMPNMCRTAPNSKCGTQLTHECRKNPPLSILLPHTSVKWPTCACKEANQNVDALFLSEFMMRCPTMWWTGSMILLVRFLCT